MGARKKILVLLQEHMSKKKKTIMAEISNKNLIRDDNSDDNEDKCHPAFDIIIREMLLEKNK